MKWCACDGARAAGQNIACLYHINSNVGFGKGKYKVTKLLLVKQEVRK